MIVGIDEVGRGCWAGPLVAAAVGFTGDVQLPGLNDSKKLTAKKRFALTSEIKNLTDCTGIGWVWPNEINELGLTEAVRLAMQRAFDQLSVYPDELIIDGSINYLPHLKNSKAVIKADGLVPAVSAASVIAKVARDTYMITISKKYPEYGFEKHVGYGTKLHIDALKQYGVLPIHRVHYKPIKRLLGSSR